MRVVFPMLSIDLSMSVVRGVCCLIASVPSLMSNLSQTDRTSMVLIIVNPDWKSMLSSTVPRISNGCAQTLFAVNVEWCFLITIFLDDFSLVNQVHR